MSISSENIVEEANALKEILSAHEQRIAHLQERVNALIDDVALLTKDVGHFKNAVSTDVKTLASAVEDLQNKNTIGRHG